MVSTSGLLQYSFMHECRPAAIHRYLCQNNKNAFPQKSPLFFRIQGSAATIPLLLPPFMPVAEAKPFTTAASYLAQSPGNVRRDKALLLGSPMDSCQQLESADGQPERQSLHFLGSIRLKSGRMQLTGAERDLTLRGSL